ncbi:hypothetical protein TNCV_4051941 [Trichonephila clavipes]|nr:hypothetical protein TNCV_4051941 [Trichonephila clavipes]
MQSSFFVCGTTSNGDVDGWASRASHVIGTVIRNVLQSGAFVFFEKKDIRVPCEGVTCALMAADEAVGCTRVFRTI